MMLESPNDEHNMTTDAHPFSRRDLLKGLTMGGLALCSSAVARADRSSTKESNVSRIFITGSTDGLGLAAARTLMAEGHQVVLHAAPQNVPPTLPISQLRLQEARQLMLNQNVDAGNAGGLVGYESASQFSREYSRLFGAPPQQDVRRMRLTN